MKYAFCSAFFLLLLLSCQLENRPGPSKLQLTEVPTPCKTAATPNVWTAADGHSFLSWAEYLNDTTDALLFSQWTGKEWSPATEIAQGDNWFVNWADFPSLVTFLYPAYRWGAC